MFVQVNSGPLAIRTAEQLLRFVASDFDPKSDLSWWTLDKLWRGAWMARDCRVMEQKEVKP